MMTNTFVSLTFNMCRPIVIIKSYYLTEHTNVLVGDTKGDSGWQVKALLL